MNIETFKRILIANELGNDESLIYRFSDADGIRTGKSGFSFGVCQFDIANNKSAMKCLELCCFSEAQIRDLLLQLIDNIEAYNQKLQEYYYIVDIYDRREFEKCIDRVLTVNDMLGLKIEDEEVVYHLADYHNQMFLSIGGQMYTFLKNLKKPVTKDAILEFKLSQRWGIKRPDDVKRRFNNIVRICQNG